MKRPKLKAPAFLADLYYDLRDRRLLPLIALVLVAIVATPILLGQHSEANLPPVGAGPIAGLKEARGSGAKLTVVEAKPGLREYRRRLRGRKPTDPFRKGPQPSLKGARLGGGKEGSGSSASTTSTSTTVKETSTTKTTTESTTHGSGGGGSGGGGAAGGQLPHGTTFSYAIDVTIVHSSGSDAEGNKQSDPPETRKRLLPPAALPGGNEVAVVTYIGVSPKTKRAVFLVSPGVTGVFGEGKCAAGTEVCQVIELEPGFPEVFEYGEGTDRYSVKVTKLEPVVTGHI